MFYKASQKTKNNFIVSLLWIIGYFLLIGIVIEIGNGFLNWAGMILFLVLPTLFGLKKIWNIQKIKINFLNEIGPFFRNSYNTPGQPKTVFWFQLYCLIIVLITFLYLFALFWTNMDGYSSMFDIIDYNFGWFLSSFASLVLYVPPLLLPRKNWVWIFNITVLSIGVTTIILIPILVPLIVLYAKPEVRKFYKS